MTSRIRQQTAAGAVRAPRRDAAPMPEVTAVDGPAPTRLRGRLLLLAGTVVGIGLLVVALPGLGQVREAFANVKPGWLVLVAALEVGSGMAYVLAFRPVFCRRLPWGLSTRIGYAEQGTNVLVPTGGAGGLALGAWALGRAGMSAGRIARRSVAFFVLTSSANFVTAIAVGALLAAGVLQTTLGPAWTLGPALAATLVLVIAVALARSLHGADTAAPASAGAGRLRRTAVKGARALGDGLRDAGDLLRTRNPTLVVGVAGYMLLDAAALWTAFYALGGAPNGATFLLAYVLGQLGGLIPVPGGLGATDGGLVGALVLYGTPLADATAAVLGYRLFQLGLPAILGALSLVSLRKNPGVITGPCD